MLSFFFRMLSHEDYQKVLDWLLSQGLSIVLLIAAVWYFQRDISSLRGEVKETQAQLLSYLKNDRDTLRVQLGNNTQVLNEVKLILTKKDNGKSK